MECTVRSGASLTHEQEEMEKNRKNEWNCEERRVMTFWGDYIDGTRNILKVNERETKELEALMSFVDEISSLLILCHSNGSGVH